MCNQGPSDTNALLPYCSVSNFAQKKDLKMVKLTVKRQEMTITPTYASTCCIQSHVMEHTAFREKTKAGRGAPALVGGVLSSTFHLRQSVVPVGRWAGEGVKIRVLNVERGHRGLH